MFVRARCFSFIWLLSGLPTAVCFAAGPEVISLWPQGLPADAKPVDTQRIQTLQRKQTEERIFYVAEPTLTLYRPEKGKANGCGMIVCPGGGYNILAWPKEGVEVARWLNTLGVTVGVLQYRVPRRDPKRPHHEPLQDGQRAIRLMRHHAEKWGVDPQRVGVLGFSAGGHLTVMTGVQWDNPAYPAKDEIDQQNCRPNFLCPIYAAYLGPEYNDRIAELGPLVRVTPKTPPMFMAVTWDDSMRGAQAALLLAELKKAKVSAELHVYAKGGHGYGIRPSDHPVSSWHQRCGEWLQASGWLTSRN